MNPQEFIECCKEKGVQCTSGQISQLTRYAELLAEWNEKINLTAITDSEEVWEKHFYDSILPSFAVPMQGRLCDVGAGAGFPSLPCKILYPELSVTILEPLNKRVVFLKEVCRELGLEGVECLNERAEDYAKEHRESFDIVTARAVANLRMLSELCIPLVKKDGLFLAMKGASAEEEQKEAEKAISVLGCSIEQKQAVSLSDGSHRMNLIYRKVRNTPMQYPRHFSKIKKYPL